MSHSTSHSTSNSTPDSATNSTTDSTAPATPPAATPDQPADGAAPYRSQGVQATTMSAWVGWIAFAGVMMALLGIFHALEGLVALFEDGYFQVQKSGLTVHVSYTVWGWVHIIGGIVVAGAGVAVFAGKLWARVVGVLVAMASAIVNIGFLAAHPVWSATMIAMDILIIWALTVHGREIVE